MDLNNWFTLLSRMNSAVKRSREIKELCRQILSRSNTQIDQSNIVIENALKLQQCEQLRIADIVDKKPTWISGAE
jgi:hypothetical protein